MIAKNVKKEEVILWATLLYVFWAEQYRQSNFNIEIIYSFILQKQISKKNFSL